MNQLNAGFGWDEFHGEKLCHLSWLAPVSYHHPSSTLSLLTPIVYSKSQRQHNSIKNTHVLRLRLLDEMFIVVFVLELGYLKTTGSCLDGMDSSLQKLISQLPVRRYAGPSHESVPWSDTSLPPKVKSKELYK